jgi:hypothetical protein
MRIKENHMSDLNTTTDTRTRGDHAATRNLHTSGRRVSSETKASYKTTELVAFVLAVIGVLIASAMVDNADFGPQEAWKYVTFLTIGYMVSRGLAKSGSRDFYDDSADHNNR